MNKPDLFTELHRVIMINDASEKCLTVHKLSVEFQNNYSQNHDRPAIKIITPGLPNNLKLVAPRKLKRRGIKSQTGRNILMHAIAHIEFNAINLALDAAYRFRNEQQEYYQDWIKIADDEARHFALIRDYLNQHNCEYGDYPAHNGLWEMAVKTDHDVVARMALVPRVLEARGLDVTPGMIDRLTAVDDGDAVAILETIYQDEIGHVKTGSQWFNYHCKNRGFESRSTFINMVEKYLHGEMKGPFNIAARLQAGFDELELESFT